MYLIIRKLTPTSPVEAFEHAFEDKQEAIDLVNAFGVAEWTAMPDGDLLATFSDGSQVQVVFAEKQGTLH